MRDIISSNAPVRRVSHRSPWKIVAGVAIAGAIVFGAILGLAANRSDNKSALRVQKPTADNEIGVANPGVVQDRLVQTDLRMALVAEKVRFTDSGSYTDDAASLKAFEPTLDYVPSLTPVAGLHRVAVGRAGATLYLSARSASGRCFYFQDDVSSGTLYATDSACGAANAQRYSAMPW
jgi:hypothetical protein